MKILLGLLWIGASALAQQADTEKQADSLERSRIKMERAAIESSFEQQEAGCYQRFAVNNCISSARKVKHDALGDLRRQEISMNVTQARARAADQLVRNETRFTPQAVQDEAQRLVQAQASQTERIKNMDERIDARAKAALETEQRITESKERMRLSAEAARQRDIKAEDESRNRKEYEARMAANKAARQSAQDRAQQRERPAAKP